MANIIEDYLCLSVTTCKRLGFFVPNTKKAGVVTWTQGAHRVASIHLETNLTGTVPFAVLSYTYKGKPVRTEIMLRFAPSNLKGNTGYYYFACPETGLSCRNLYLVEGKFVSRSAFRPLYRAQAETRLRRDAVLRSVVLLREYQQQLDERNRRLKYRGKLTPWGRKLTKRQERLTALYEYLRQPVGGGEWQPV